MKPTAVSDLDLAFPAHVAHLMPPYAEIPEEFKEHHNPYVRMQAQWFYRGLPKDALRPKPGIDGNAALRHLTAIQRSFEPKHEHKEAAVAYLMSQWFDLA